MSNHEHNWTVDLLNDNETICSICQVVMDDLMCNHTKLVCPAHEGSFDCTPFCKICEGNCEYCATCDSWEAGIAMVLDVIGQMYNEYDQATLEELRQRIV